MRKRHQTGGVRKQRGRWMGLWWVDGKRKSVTLGLIKDMTKGQALEAVARIVAEEDARRQADRVWKLASSLSRSTSPTTAGNGNTRRGKTT